MAIVDEIREKLARSAAERRPREELAAEWAQASVALVEETGWLESRFNEAVEILWGDCIESETLVGGLVLREGGPYRGTWLESTGTISAEVLARYLPGVAWRTFSAFLAWQRDDGLIPYKIQQQRAHFDQVQVVTPLSRTAGVLWRLAGGLDAGALAQAYDAIARFDRWLVRHRQTRGTGCLEAFCTFDTGHDGSPRFWHIPDRTWRRQADRYDPNSPLLPLLAPDLTAMLYAQRQHLARLADALARPGDGDYWRGAAEETRAALFRECFDHDDGLFYDRDRQGQWIRVNSDVLLRVLDSGVGDAAFFEAALRRYLLNSRHFFAAYPFPSVALSDPRFDGRATYNSWAGATNLLTLLRAPHTFEHYGHVAELAWVMDPAVQALADGGRFPQALDPWTGQNGYGERYSPAVLCFLDYLERLAGILVSPSEELWFSGLMPSVLSERAGEAVLGYQRVVHGVIFQLIHEGGELWVYRDGALWLRAPSGVRVVTDLAGRLVRLVGLKPTSVQGLLWYDGIELAVDIAGNAVWAWRDGELTPEASPGVVFPSAS